MPFQTNHSAKIETAIASDEAAKYPLVASWQRSSQLHDLTPEKSHAPERLTASEFNEAYERLGLLVNLSETNLDQLFLAVGDIGCSVILADRNGVAIARRGAIQDDTTFNKWGLWTGAIWSEESEGTNGVGTCIVEQRPLTIHKDQHFHSKNTGLSCTAAPIFDHEGNLMAVIDVSSCRADLTSGFLRLITAAVINTARTIETNHFSKKFATSRIILAQSETKHVSQPSKGATLIAVNEDDLVIGATRGARNLYGLNDQDLKKPKPLSELYGNQVDQAQQYTQAKKRIIQQAMASSGGNISAAARSLGISRATLHRKLNKYNIKNL